MLEDLNFSDDTIKLPDLDAQDRLLLAMVAEPDWDDEQPADRPCLHAHEWSVDFVSCSGERWGRRCCLVCGLVQMCCLDDLLDGLLTQRSIEREQACRVG